MTRTQMLRRQHDAAELIAAEILEALDGPASSANAYAISLKLAKLHGLLRIHLAQEDHSLYPAMIASDDAAASLAATAFKAEMGGLSNTFAAYVDRWATSTVIEASFERFLEETKTVLGALAHRIKRENEELYPLADSLRDEDRPRAA